MIIKIPHQGKKFINYFLPFVFLVVSLIPSGVFAQAKTITGKITGSDGAPIAGVTVQEQGTSAGTATDASGNFSLSVVNTNATLNISSLGYESESVKLQGRTTIAITLKGSAAQQLQQVVVVGYGTQRKIDVTGSVAQIKGEEIAKQSSFNPLSALQGKVAGVQITNTGSPGAPPQITIRGVGTVYGNTNPLFVVDGVWYDDVIFKQQILNQLVF